MKKFALALLVLVSLSLPAFATGHAAFSFNHGYGTSAFTFGHGYGGVSSIYAAPVIVAPAYSPALAAPLAGGYGGCGQAAQNLAAPGGCGMTQGVTAGGCASANYASPAISAVTSPIVGSLAVTSGYGYNGVGRLGVGYGHSLGVRTLGLGTGYGYNGVGTIGFPVRSRVVFGGTNAVVVRRGGLLNGVDRFFFGSPALGLRGGVVNGVGRALFGTRRVVSPAAIRVRHR